MKLGEPHFTLITNIIGSNILFWTKKYILKPNLAVLTFMIINFWHYKVLSEIGILRAVRSSVLTLQQGLEICGLEQCGPWRYRVFNWIQKYFDFWTTLFSIIMPNSLIDRFFLFCFPLSMLTLGYLGPTLFEIPQLNWCKYIEMTLFEFPFSELHVLRRVCGWCWLLRQGTNLPFLMLDSSQVWVFWEGHKIWKNLRRTFDKSVMFCTHSNSVLIKNPTRIFENKWGQVTNFNSLDFVSTNFEDVLPGMLPSYQLS